jgi:UDP-N-acetyl-2-amino-2-deoxyglucuronate dehydrogenase
MTRRWNIAVIGAGMGIAPHALSLQDLSERVTVAGVFTRNAQRRNGIAHKYGFPAANSVDELINRRDVDAVLVATPPNAHLEIVRQAARAGKHVLCEKPLEITTSLSEEVVNEARRAGVKLGVVLQYRTRKNARYLTSLVQSGKLGKLATASISIRWWRNQSYYDQSGRGTLARDGGGVLISQAIHGLDLFQSLTGPVHEVVCFAGTSRLHRMEGEDIACAALRFGNGAIGGLDASTAVYPGFPERYEFVFESATALLVTDDLTLYRQDGTLEQLVSAQSHGGGADPMAYSHEHHRNIIEDFLDALDEDRDPLVTGEEALKTHRLIDALVQSSRGGRAVVVAV